MQVQDSANTKLENGQYKFLDWIEGVKQQGDWCRIELIWNYKMDSKNS